MKKGNHIHEGNLGELREHLNKFRIVSKWLQTEKFENVYREVNFSTCRKTFNKLCDMYPKVGAKKGIIHWLGSDAEIIQDRDFEKAVEKVHAGESYCGLSSVQKGKLGVWKIGNITSTISNTNSTTSTRNSNFLSDLLDEAQEQFEERVSARGGLRSTKNILRVNNIYERLFSRTGLIMTDRGKHMDPSTLETLIMLRMNKDLWDQRDVQSVIDNYGEINDQEGITGRVRNRDEIGSAEDFCDDSTIVSTITTSESSQTSSSNSTSRRVVPAHGWSAYGFSSSSSSLYGSGSNGTSTRR